MRKFSTGFYEVFERLMNLAIWNTIWVIHTILGLGILGWAPATVALFTVLRKEKREESEFPKLRTFFQIYKSEFIRSNIIGFFLVFGGMSLLFTFNTLLTMDLWIRVIFGTLLFVVLVLYVIVSLYIFPVYTHYQTTLRQHVKYSLVIGLAYLPYSLLLAIVVVGISYIYQLFPGLILFYLISFPATIMLTIALKVFDSIEVNDYGVVQGTFNE
ncbi:YesL family protein [Salipaludibacillus sp. HK11]|uniref:YesL family protein n=1 Tax=Salipaludibacillus sp. HK11 TaxID=3394320 RepID=UPI0039FD182A